jgi:thiol-disulfide isomerase/thioredoxin
MKSTYVYTLLVIGLIIGLIAVRNTTDGGVAPAPSAYDTFAQCLTDAGAKFYGAFWCPHCQEQKALLKNSKLIPYIECSTPNGQAQTPQCADVGITGYPTWIFADASRIDRAMQLAELSEKTQCQVPQE